MVVEESVGETKLPATAEPPPVAVLPASPAAADPAPKPVALPSTPVRQPDPEPELPPAEPELSVVMVGKKITVSGALRSRIQQERIVNALTRDFAEHEIVSDLKVEYHRNGVGWGNRVADEFLVPFLKSVQDGSVVYREHVVTLEGTVGSAGDERSLAELAIVIFSGSDTRDLKSNLKVAKP